MPILTQIITPEKRKMIRELLKEHGSYTNMQKNGIRDENGMLVVSRKNPNKE